jgi:nucleoside-diphosphate-sugar epimerase
VKVLIIGGTRFLGAAIARELVARGHNVTVLHRGRTTVNVPETVEHIHCEAHDPWEAEPHLKRGFDAVIDTILTDSDLAWYLPLFQDHAERFIHCGSTGVYTPMGRIPAREDDPTPCPDELGGFGQKLAQDMAILSFHTQTGYNACSLRISNVFGPGDVPLDGWGARNPAWFRRVANHEEVWIPNDGRALVQPVHVADLARGFCGAMESDKAAGQIYNLSSAHAVTLDEYVTTAKEILKSSSPVRYVAMEEILATGKANESGIRFVCEHMCIDSSKAHRDFGYEPRVSFDHGLAESIEWTRKYRWDE